MLKTREEQRRTRERLPKPVEQQKNEAFISSSTQKIPEISQMAPINDDRLQPGPATSYLTKSSSRLPEHCLPSEAQGIAPARPGAAYTCLLTKADNHFCTEVLTSR